VVVNCSPETLVAELSATVPAVPPNKATSVVRSLAGAISPVQLVLVDQLVESLPSQAMVLA